MSGVLSVLAADAPSNLWSWLSTSSVRQTSGSIPSNLWVTLQHAVGAVLLAAVVAVPSAALLAHARRGRILATTIVNLGRIVPTITILAIAVVVSLRNGFGFAPWPIVIALFAMSLPPLFANTYTGIVEVSPDAVAAARAVGMSEGQVLRQVELPLALPLILAGLRTALTQAIATEALGALFGGEGLGNYIAFGIADKDNPQIQAGALLIAATAMSADALLALATRLTRPAGLRTARSSRPGRAARRRPVLTTHPQPGGTP
jgi:osmoprotectant transport system permease protein